MKRVGPNPRSQLLWRAFRRISQHIVIARPSRRGDRIELQRFALACPNGADNTGRDEYERAGTHRVRLVPRPHFTVPFEHKERLFADLVVTPCACTPRFEVEESNAALITLRTRRGAAASQFL